MACPYAIAIASRSTAVDDLDAAIAKLHRHSRRRVYLTRLAGRSFVDPELLRLLEIEPHQTPDESLLMGILAQRNLQATFSYIETPSRLAGCHDCEEFARRLSWSCGPLDDVALTRLRMWYEEEPVRAARGGRPMRWIFVSWPIEANSKCDRSTAVWRVVFGFEYPRPDQLPGVQSVGPA